MSTAEDVAAKPSTGFGEAVETFRLPYYGRLWSSNLVQFICFHVLLLAMQWLVTSLTELRTAVGLLAFIQGGSVLRRRHSRSGCSSISSSSPTGSYSSSASWVESWRPC